MKIKKLKKIKINCSNFIIKWDEANNGGNFNYLKKELKIGVKGGNELTTFMVLCHEIMEIVMIEMNVRLYRPDCADDFIFVYDHRQYDTAMTMFSGIIDEFIV